MNDLIRKAASDLGFDACGFARAGFLEKDAAFLRNWLDAGYQGEMLYLNRNFEKRTDPRLLVPGCKSLVVVLLNYFPEKVQDSNLPLIARYAYSAIDYHTVIKQKLAHLEVKIREIAGQEAVETGCQHRFVDSAPVLEKRWAQIAGLGWLGKHTQLISTLHGSWVFIGIIMLNIELPEYDSPVKNRCGNCTRCIDACPTRALSENGLDARKCISYLTIEHQSEIDPALSEKLSGWKVGCDICQEVCPWNHKKESPHNHPELDPVPEIFNWTAQDWNQADETTINRIFGQSAIKRALGKI